MSSSVEKRSSSLSSSSTRSDDGKFRMNLRSQGQVQSSPDVGPEFQAEVGEYNPDLWSSADDRRRETPLWIPTANETKINRLFEEVILIRQPLAGDEDALYCLYACGYDERHAAAMLFRGFIGANLPARTTSRHPSRMFTRQENAKFEEGLITYGSDFWKIRKYLFPNLKVGDLVDWYYRWKKSPLQANFARRVRLAVANKELRVLRRRCS